MHSHVFGPLPDNQFILNNKPVERPQPLTTTTKAGRKAAAGTKRKAPGTKTDVGGSKKKSRTTRKTVNVQQKLRRRPTMPMFSKMLMMAPAIPMFSSCSYDCKDAPFIITSYYASNC
jgi:hypothetical protein